MDTRGAFKVHHQVYTMYGRNFSFLHHQVQMIFDIYVPIEALSKVC